ITNAGVINATFTGIFVHGVNVFGAGGISNSGTVSTAINNAIFVGGFATNTTTPVTISSFSDGISNSGAISAGANGVVVGGTASRGGNLVVSTFSGGISNSGTITATRSGIRVGGSASF